LNKIVKQFGKFKNIFITYSIGNLIKVIVYNTLWNLPIYFLYILSIGYSLNILRIQNEDALKLLNYSFAAIAILSGLCFAWSACLGNEDIKKDRITYSGERFLHSSILILIAILLKYLGVKYNETFFLGKWIIFLYKIMIIYSIFMALLFFHAGLHTISKYLWISRFRHKDWNKMDDDFTYTI